MSALSAGEQIVQAMIAALNAPSPKPCTFYRTRIDALASEELPAGVLYSGEEESMPKTATVMERTRKVNLELAVQGPPRPTRCWIRCTFTRCRPCRPTPSWGRWCASCGTGACSGRPRPRSRT